jgi:hypothetical protein
VAIVSSIPVSLATNIVRNVALQAVFDVDLDRSSVTDLNVLLIKASDGTSVSGIVDYVPGIRAITFQLAALLEKNTQYNWIIVGRTQGIKTLSQTAALSTNFQISFTTGSGLDYTLPLAPVAAIAGAIPSFQGGRGVYDVVFGATGEPISHVVTTAGQVGLSGNIVQAPFSTDVYIAISGIPEKIAVVSTTPTDTAHFLNADNLTNSPIVITFDNPPVNTGLINGGIDISVLDMLDFPTTIPLNTPTWTTSISGNNLTITPSVWRPGTIYTVTVSSLISSGAPGTELGTNYVFTFDLKPQNYYSSVTLIRANLGDSADNITNSQIENLIYENSVWAFQHYGGVLYGGGGFSDVLPPLYVKDYVLCKTKMDVINLILMSSEQPISEKVGEVEFKYANRLIEKFRDKMTVLEACVEQSAELLLNFGYSADMRIAVRGQRFPGAPGTSSTWRRIGDNGSFPRRDGGF